METFLAILRALLDSGLEPIQATIQTTPHGSHGHEIVFAFAPADEPRIVDVLDELEQLGCEPRYTPGALLITAGVGAANETRAVPTQTEERLG